MKALIVLLAVLAGVWLWRRGQRIEAPRRPTPPGGALPVMLRCARCGTHVPASDAVTGAGGLPYCCAAHRRESEPA